MTATGFFERYLRVDLRTGTSTVVPLPPSVPRRFLGGVGLGSWLLHREAPVGVDPLDPAAPLIFCFSPFVGTPLTTSAKFAVVAKSPLTGMISDALSSSHFAIAGKKLGVDAIVFVGRAREPSIWIDSAGERSLEPAGEWWGRPAEEVEAALSDRGRVAAIGLAGENLVRYATISNDGRHAGRGGLGAVMGSKRLKAIAVRGDAAIPVAKPRRVVALAKDLSKRSFGPATAKYRELGTVSNLLAFNRLASLPTRNFQSGTFDEAERLAPETIAPAREKARKSCAACTIGCEHIYSLADGRTTRMEYENLFALGPLCGISDPDAVLSASKRCDELGLDTISAGGTIAFIMECAERGLLEPPFDRAPHFGDADRTLELLDEIAHRDGALGDLLAEGSRRAAEHIGHDSIEFAPQVKGLEIPGYEPRALQTLALGFAVGTRGADHNKSGAYEVDLSEAADRLTGTEDGARRAVETEDKAALMDSLILCKFLRGVFDDLPAEAATLLEAITGWDATAEELRATARRIVALKKAFNIREGWTPDLDTLPGRFLTSALPTGASRGATLPRERLRVMIRSYYSARGWTEDGFLPDCLRADLDAPQPGPAASPGS